MTQKPRIVFMGTPEFAVGTLKKLIDHDYNIVGVITAPDRPAGRGKKLKESAVKQYAKKIGLPILQPTNLKSEAFNDELKNLNPDLQIVVAFRMLPKMVWQLPTLGTFNLHASLLPDYRGAAPINWAIINGETETGVTTFFIDDKIDTGEIILQEKVAIAPDDSASDLHDKLMEKGSDLVLKTVNLIAIDHLKTQAQPKIDWPKKAPKLNAENTRINWEQKGQDIYNLIRGLSEYPGAWTMLQTGEDEAKKLIIYKSRFEQTEHNEPIKNITHTKKSLKIAVPDGYIYPEIIKLQGKKMMDIQAFLNGLRDKEIGVL